MVLYIRCCEAFAVLPSPLPRCQHLRRAAATLTRRRPAAHRCCRRCAIPATLLPCCRRSRAATTVATPQPPQSHHLRLLLRCRLSSRSYRASCPASCHRLAPLIRPTSIHRCLCPVPRSPARWQWRWRWQRRRGRSCALTTVTGQTMVPRHHHLSLACPRDGDDGGGANDVAQ
jgi:hypothetical protein